MGVFRFLDTKVMASSQPFRDRLPNSALGQLLQALSKDPFKLGDICKRLNTKKKEHKLNRLNILIKFYYCFEKAPIPDAKHYTLSQTKSHEAGYDSYITGLCFISMSNYLGTH